MSNELATIQDAVREEVKQSIMRVLPAGVVDELVSNILEKEIKQELKKELEKVIKDKFSEEINTQVHAYIYGGDVSREFEKLMKDSGKCFMEGLMQSILQNTLTQLQNSAHAFTSHRY